MPMEIDTTVVVRSGNIFDAPEELDVLSDRFNTNIVYVDVEEQKISSRIHGLMLDGVVEKIDSDYILTLDSDCFPVMTGWLSGLFRLMETKEGVGCVGILHPYAPPSEDLNITSLEFRVRSQHCWNNTHVACQMIPKHLIDDLNLKYADGDDTGLMIPLRIKHAGYCVRGYKATRSPFLDGVDCELNRSVSIIYGNKIYHHGHYTREKLNYDDIRQENVFDEIRNRVIENNGAEFLLDDEYGYKIKYDREEEVARHKMDILFGMRV